VREHRGAPEQAPKRSNEELAAERRSRAFEEPLDVRPRPGAPYARFEVRNPRRKTRYVVLLPEFPGRSTAFCDCTDFGRRGIGTCKHVEAVLIWHSENPREGAAAPRPFDPGPVWADVDRRLARWENDRAPDAIRDRRPGRALVDAANA
jgi:hypothetical protein